MLLTFEHQNTQFCESRQAKIHITETFIMTDQVTSSPEERGERFLQWLAKTFNDGNLHGAQAAGAEAMSIRRGTLNRYVQGKSQPNRKMMELFESFGLSIPWLLHGRGPMYNPAAFHSKEQPESILDFGDREPLSSLMEQAASYAPNTTPPAWWAAERGRLIEDVARRVVEALRNG